MFLACVILSILCIYIGIFGSLGSISVCVMSETQNNLSYSYLLKVPQDNCTDYGGTGKFFSFFSKNFECSDLKVQFMGKYCLYKVESVIVFFQLQQD